MNKTVSIILVIALSLVVVLTIFFSATPIGVSIWNNWFYNVQKTDDSNSAEKQSWAEQAKMRANKTAMSYNNYVLKNSFVWEDNIPADIKRELPIVE